MEGVRRQQRCLAAAGAGAAVPAWLYLLLTIVSLCPCQVHGQANRGYGFRGFTYPAGKGVSRGYNTDPKHPSGNGQGAFAHAPPGSPKNRLQGHYTGEGAQAQYANPGDPRNRAIPELDKPTLARDSRKINILPVRSQWQAVYLPALPAEKLMAASLYSGIGQNFSLPVKLDGNMAITVHPRRGFTVWNITYLDVQLTVHPYFNAIIRQNMAIKHGEKAVQAMPVVMPTPGRRKRCCIAGATNAKSMPDIQSINAGLGVSLGPGSLTYFKEDVAGGMYNLTTMNLGAAMAEIVVFTTLDPEYSPYPRIHGIDPQLKVDKIDATTLTMSWDASIEHPENTYCFIYHRAQDHFEDDVHSSSFAAWMERDTATHLRCVKSGANKQNTLTIKNLQPSTEYHIDLLAHNVNTQRESTYMGVQVRTAGRHTVAHHGGYHPGAVRTPTGLIRTPLPHVHHHTGGGGGVRRDPPPGFIASPRRSVFDQTRPPRPRIPKQPYVRPKAPGPGRPQIRAPYNQHSPIYHPQGAGQRPRLGQRAGAGQRQQVGYFNPANPLGLTVFPPSAVSPVPPLVPHTQVINVYTPVKPPSNRKPWYQGHIAEVGKTVNKYYAPSQWMRLRSHRDLRHHSESSAGPGGVTTVPAASRLLVAALGSLVGACHCTYFLL